ncbi:MAG: RNA polymerase sigma factor [Planctomycetota bacterium]|jgi:RNA polymerase sigma-70 factor (ECF subfamily)
MAVRRVPLVVTDEQLMTRVARGEMEAFAELVERHQQAALNVAYRFLGDATLAEDVAQEAFLKVLDGASRYRPTGRFRAYLHSVIWHACVDQYRKRRTQGLNSVPVPANGGPGPVQAALEDERATAVREAVQTLPPRQRMALVLQHFEGLSYEEIGQTLDCPATAVDALLVRAKRRLRDMLRDVL